MCGSGSGSGDGDVSRGGCRGGCGSGRGDSAEVVGVDLVILVFCDQIIR